MNEQFRVIGKVFSGLDDLVRLGAAAGSAYLVSVFGSLAWAAYALLGAMVIDVFTGGVRAWLMGNFTSKDFKFGCAYKVFMWVTVAVSALVDYVIGNMTGQAISAITLFALGWYFVGEVTSILENMALTGFKSPPAILSGLAVVKQKLEQIGGSLAADKSNPS